jgi:hypothetical protein
MNNNGFDKYLEYQFQQTGHFYTALFELIQRADDENLKKLAMGFPQEVEAYITFARVGVGAFLAKCTPSHPLIPRMKSDMGID